MCGIFGLIPGQSASGRSLLAERHLVEELLLLSEARGKDASGVALLDDTTISVLKQPYSASRLVRSKEFKELFSSQPNFQVAIGHARMETNGSFARSYNNQPIVKDGCVTIHNGIIVNEALLWSANPDLCRHFEVDTEIYNSLIRKYLTLGLKLDRAVLAALQKLTGAFSTATLLSEYGNLVLATNTGSLYYLDAPGEFIFVSERHFLKRILERRRNNSVVSDYSQIKQLNSGSCLIYDLYTHKWEVFNISDDVSFQSDWAARNGFSREIKLIIDGDKGELASQAQVSPPANTASARVVSGLSGYVESEYNRNRQVIDGLPRCSRCILPVTMPFIKFDAAGVCNYCKRYRGMNPKGIEHFEELMVPFRRTDGQPECVVPFSGGRDSSYGLYYIKEVLGLKPITFTYDWGMVTDLARRNIARVCGKLGVENILVSADIQAKRNNIKKNVLAWLKKPHLGTVPLFMAGDKHFLYYSNKVKRETGALTDIWLSNWLESTHFKVGFCGIGPASDESRVDALSAGAKIKLLAFYGKAFLGNPSYWNSSVGDTLFAFYSYYFEPRPNYYLLFDYLPWDERRIEQTLFSEFDWERAPDTKSTWRIGDGTAPFYNYIYYTMAGFTEVDTFRSNQIREGMITRAQGLEMTVEENAPRLESLAWYFEKIGVDLEQALRVINSQPKLYDVEKWR